MKLDSIFKALGVETMEDVNKLSSYFLVQEASKNNGDDSDEKLIHPNEVIRALRRFAESQRSRDHPGLKSHKEEEEEDPELDADGTISFFSKLNVLNAC